MKKFRFTENFNPIARMTANLNESGVPIFEPAVSKLGNILLTKEGQMVLVPKLQLKLQDYKDWWNTVYPEGRTEKEVTVSSVTACNFVQNGGATSPIPYPYNEKTVTVRFFTDKESVLPKAIGTGSVTLSYDGNSNDGLAEYLAWKSGMSSMGFGTDITAGDMLEYVPHFCEVIEGTTGYITSSEKTVSVAPVKSEEGELTVSYDENPETPAKEEPKKMRKSRKKAETEPSPAPEPPIPVPSEPETVPFEEPIFKEADEITGEVVSPLVEITAELPFCEIASEPAPAPIEAKEEEIPLEELLIDLEPEEETRIEWNRESALAVVTQFRDGKSITKFMPYIGKTIGELKDLNPAFVNYLARPAYQEIFTEEVFSAATYLQQIA